MKKIIAGIFVLIFTALVSIGCSVTVVSGVWENVIKENSGSIVTTTITITENYDSFNGTMVTKIDGTENDNLRLSVKSVEISGYISGKILVIEQINKLTEPYFKRSTLTLSEDGNSMTLSPGAIIFTKK